MCKYVCAKELLKAEEIKKQFLIVFGTRKIGIFFVMSLSLITCRTFVYCYDMSVNNKQKFLWDVSWLHAASTLISHGKHNNCSSPSPSLQCVPQAVLYSIKSFQNWKLSVLSIAMGNWLLSASGRARFPLSYYTRVAADVIVSKTCQPLLWHLVFVELQSFNWVRMLWSFTKTEAFDEHPAVQSTSIIYWWIMMVFLLLGASVSLQEMWTK